MQHTVLQLPVQQQTRLPAASCAVNCMQQIACTVGTHGLQLPAHLQLCDQLTTLTRLSAITVDFLQRAAAAAEAAAKAAAEAASHQASATAASSHWDRWEQAMIQTYGANDSSATAAAQNPTGSAAVNPAAASPVPALTPQQQADLDSSRAVRQQQDEEFRASLAADAQKKKERELAALLKKLKASLAAALPPEAAAAAAGGSDAAASEDADASSATTLAIRVRLPDGRNAVRQFAGVQNFADVLDWVYSLPGMPLLQPGAWGLASSFPRRQLAAAAGLWAPGSSGVNFSSGDLKECVEAGSSLGKQRENAGDEAGYEAAPAGALSLSVRSLVGEAFSVQVLQRSSILEVKRQVEQQTGERLSEGWLRHVCVRVATCACEG
jgi:hypothetical protein